VDQRVIWLSMLAAVIAGVSAGVAPAFLALRMDVSSALKTGAGSTFTGGDLRTPLLVTQAALCTALLACGGTFLQSLRRASAFDRGFDPARTIQLAIPASHANAESELARLAERLRAVPDVDVVGRTYTPIGQIGMASKVGPTASDTIGLGARGPSLEFVEPAFLRAAGMRVVSGRLMTPGDDFAMVAVLNESLARALFPQRNAVGACVHVREPSSPCREIIGVVRDVRWDVTVPATYRAYVPLPQAWTVPNRALIPNYLYVRLRSAALPADVARLRALVTPLMAYPAELSIQRLSELLAPQLRPWRIAAVLFLLFGALGLIAAATGIYGLVAYDVVQRSRDIGVRMALGATRARIVQQVIGTGLRLVLAGIGFGILVALGVGRVMASLLFETTPFDPTALSVTAIVLSGAAILASLMPAWRASRLNPAALLSTE
jgi:predicted permease